MFSYLKSFDNLTTSNVTEEPETVSYINVALSRKICLILFSTLLVPSVLLALYIFYWIFRMPEIRNRLTNHLIIGIFVVSFIQVRFKFQTDYSIPLQYKSNQMFSWKPCWESLYEKYDTESYQLDSEKIL